MPATIKRAWTRIKDFIKRHEIAFATPFMLLTFLMYRGEGGHQADLYSVVVTFIFFGMLFYYSGLITGCCGFRAAEEYDDATEPSDTDKPVEKVTTQGHYTWRA